MLAFEDIGPPLQGLGARRVSELEAVTRVASGRYRAVICGLGGRIALPGAYLAARARGIPFVLWATIWEHPRTLAHRLSWRPTRHLYRHADAVATYGSHVSAYVERHRPGTHNVFVAPQAVDVEHFGALQPPEAVRAARERAGVANGEPLVLFVGRLEAEKGVDDLLAAWERADLAPGAKLVLAGSGPQERKIAPRKDVRILGYLERPELPALYAAADVLVLPSVATATFREPWGLVVNEAMLQRTPVIASDAVGAAAGGLVEDGCTGAVFAAGDVPALTRALSLLTGDRALREGLGGAARERALTLDPPAWADGMRSALASVGVAR